MDTHMMTGKKAWTWEKILGQLEAEAKVRSTVPVPEDWKLRYHADDGKARLVFGDVEYGFKDNVALNSVLTMLRAPASFLKRIPNERAQRNVDELRESCGVKLKARLEEIDGNLFVRGVVRENTSDISDLEIFRAVHDSVSSDFVPEFFLETSKQTQLRLIDQRRESVGALSTGEPDLHSYGFDLLSGELGWTPFTGDAVGWRQVCTNGMVARTAVGIPFYKRTYKNLTPELVTSGAEAISKVIPVYRDTYMGNLKKSKEAKLPTIFHPGSGMRQPTMEFVDEVGKLMGVRKPADKLVLDLATRVAAEGGSTAYDLANALTWSAHGRENRQFLETRANIYVQLRAGVA